MYAFACSGHFRFTGFLREAPITQVIMKVAIRSQVIFG